MTQFIVRLKVTSVLLMAFGVSPSIQAKDCKEWIDSMLALKQEKLKASLSVYHWFNCSNVEGFTTPNRLSSVIDAHVRKTVIESSGVSGKGLYAATDPSATCAFGNGTKHGDLYSNACLLVLDIPAGQALPFQPDPYTEPGEEFYRAGDALGCFDKAKEKAQYEAFLREDDLNDRDDRDALRPPRSAKERAEARSMESFRKEYHPLDYLKPIDGLWYLDYRKTFLERNTTAHSYGYSSNSIGDKKITDKRAVVITKELLPELSYRVYHRKDLQTMKTPEARNIARHLQQETKSNLPCLDPKKGLRLKKTDKEDPSYASWLERVGSQYNFRDLVEAQFVEEKESVTHE